MSCTKVNCCFTMCKYNSACCINPANEDTYCTLKGINLEFNEEYGVMECAQLDEDHNKPYECTECQLEKYGEIELETDYEFIKVEDIEDLFE